MSFIAAFVTVSAPIFPILLKFSKSKTLPACQVQRAKIILLAADGLNNMQISKQVGLGQDSVSKWRNRFLKSDPFFQELAQKDPSCLENKITAFLMDRSRSGYPADFTDEQIIKILEIADSISAKMVSRFLKYGANPPA